MRCQAPGLPPPLAKRASAPHAAAAPSYTGSAAGPRARDQRRACALAFSASGGLRPPASTAFAFASAERSGPGPSGSCASTRTPSFARSFSSCVGVGRASIVWLLWLCREREQQHQFNIAEVVDLAYGLAREPQVGVAGSIRADDAMRLALQRRQL